MKRYDARKLTTSALHAALIWALTFLVKVPVPATGGYIHAGDGAVFWAATLLGPHAALAAGIGSALADLLGGYFVYALPTFLIKGVMAAIAGKLSQKGHSVRNALVFLMSGATMITGYFLFDGFMAGWPTALASIGPNLLQGIFGVVLGVALTMLPFPPGFGDNR